MENFDNASDCSDNSDTIKSNASTLSGLSCYQNEFEELRHLVHPEKYPKAFIDQSLTPKRDEGYVSYDKDVFNLSDTLEKSQLAAEKYKLELDGLEKKIEFKYCDNIKKLLRNNTRLEVQLGNANIEIKRLINFLAKNENSGSEKRCHDLLLENNFLQKKCLEIKDENEKHELEIKDFKLILNDIVTENKVGKSCIQGLKDKIASQHVRIENLSKKNCMLTSNLNNIQIELEQVRKSKEWYKKELHDCQIEKQKLGKNILEYKHKLSLQYDKIELLNIELEKQENKCDEIKLKALKEKESLLKKIENSNIFFDKLEKEPTLNSSLEVNNSSELEYKFIIEDLTQQIHRVKSEQLDVTNNFDRVSKENSELVSKCLVLQKTLQQNESSVEVLELQNKGSLKKIEALSCLERQRSNEILKLNNEKINLKLELASYRHEKEMVDNSIKLIRNQFLKFKECYEKVKDDLQYKNKQILLLQGEKQEMFMQNNWTVCELERTKEKDVVIGKLKTDIAFYDIELKTALGRITFLETEISKRQDIIKEKCDECQKYEDVIVQYRTLSDEHKNKIQQLQENSYSVVEQLNQTVKILNTDIANKDKSLRQLQEKVRDLENEHILQVEKNMTEKNILTEENKKLIKAYSTPQNFASMLNNCETNKFNFNVPSLVSQFFLNGATFSSKVNTILCNKALESAIGNSILKFEENALEQLCKIQEKMIGLSVRNADCSEKLNKLFEERIKSSTSKDVNEKLKELRVLLQVKELELKEKQKKYEINNRTLLRKVKEHIRGRHTAEKHNKDLQELYNTLSNENNSLKLEVGSKNNEIENLQKLTNKYQHLNEKLKETVINLEKHIADAPRVCEECLELKELKQNLNHQKESLQEILLEKDKQIHSLNKEIEILRANTTSLAEQCDIKDREILCNNENINLLRYEVYTQKNVVNELGTNLKEEQQKYGEIATEKICLNVTLEQKNHELEQCKNKIEILSLDLQHKTEEIKRLEDSKTMVEDSYRQKEQYIEKTVFELRHCLETTQNEMSSLESEKHFLQRLCKDLKLSLRTHISQNEVLKDRLRNPDKDNPNNFSSLPTTLLPTLPTVGEYDETLVSSLLEEYKKQNNKPVFRTSEIQSHLDSLRKEILTLQEEIVKKNAKR